MQVNLQSLDIHTTNPAEDGKSAKLTPVLIMIHGGGWRRGDKAGVGVTRHKAPHFVASGYVYVSINYRPSATPDGPKHPAHVQDCAKAIAWVHDNIAKYGGAPNRVFVMGHSAGAHLAALVSTDHRRLEAEDKKLSIIAHQGVSGQAYPSRPVQAGAARYPAGRWSCRGQEGTGSRRSIPGRHSEGETRREYVTA